jgi:hypothetical protein
VGVPYVGGTAVSSAAPPPEESTFDPQRLDHWAFRPVAHPPVPATAKAGAVNPIDAFLEAERQKRKLAAAPEADRRTLIRRLYLDMAGVPPTHEEVIAYLADKSPNAYEKLVDRLLASPKYGEKWGRHWLDIWRYSDWYGWRKENQVRFSQRHIWRWRDWTIESLNKNKPYDRMIREMLAGDEIAPTDPNVLAATGFLGRNYYKMNRNSWLQDAAEYTAGAFLGLTMKCARCHTHKYDPITHVDYYRFRAFFEPYNVRLDRVPGDPDTLKAGLARIYDADAATPTYRFLRGNEDNPDKEHPLTPAVPSFFAAKLDIKPVKLPIEAWYPDGREFVQGDVLQQARGDLERAEASLVKARGKLAELTAAPATAPADLVKAQNAAAIAEKHVASLSAALPAVQARIAADRARFAVPPAPDAEKLADEAKKLERRAGVRQAEEEVFQANLALSAANGDEKKSGSAQKRLEEALKALGAAKDGYTPIGEIYPETSSGRRLALAQWITGKDNPLTARVAINDMWLRHFGKALVPTVFNFGRSGKPPSHPELLDWLATEFMAHDWDMKYIHRLMVTSRAYRMQSNAAADSPNLAIDPDNTYLWRMNLRRMEAEDVRDSLLAIAGKLDSTMGGPDINESKADQVFRRSIYFHHAPDAQVEILKVFDMANPAECYERSESVVPQQALALANSPLSYLIARTIAKQITDGIGAAATDSQYVAAVFETFLGRLPSAKESAESAAFLSSQAALYRDPAALTNFHAGESASLAPAKDPVQRARESLAHVIINHNDFVTIH